MPFSNNQKNGLGGYKTCPECGSLNHSAARFCKGQKQDWLSQEHLECGYMFPLNEKKEDLVTRDMVKFFTDGINVSNLIQLARINGWELTFCYWKILSLVSSFAGKNFGSFLLSEQLDFLIDIAFKKARELGKYTDKKCWRESIKKNLIDKLKLDGFVLDIEEIGVQSELSFLKQKEIENGNTNQ